MSRERPILFSAPMVRAILAGTKTQTRRVAKIDDVVHGKPVQWVSVAPCTTGIMEVRCPYGEPGSRLWVRETWAQNWNQLSETRMDRSYVYRADGETRAQDNGTDLPWRPSIHMARAASRITLEITGVRVERLQDISEADAMAEGIVHSPRFGGYHTEDGRHFHAADPRQSYASLWEQINGPGSWDANPWVWVLEFRRLERQ